MLKGKKKPSLYLGLVSGEPNILTYTKFKLEKGPNKLQIKLANKCLLSKFKVVMFASRLDTPGSEWFLHGCTHMCSSSSCSLPI